MKNIVSYVRIKTFLQYLMMVDWLNPLERVMALWIKSSKSTSKLSTSTVQPPTKSWLYHLCHVTLSVVYSLPCQRSSGIHFWVYTFWTTYLSQCIQVYKRFAEAGVVAVFFWMPELQPLWLYWSDGGVTMYKSITVLCYWWIPRVHIPQRATAMRFAFQTTSAENSYF